MDKSKVKTLGANGTLGAKPVMFSISQNFTAEHAENAKASESSAWLETVFLIENSPTNQSNKGKKKSV